MILVEHWLHLGLRFAGSLSSAPPSAEDDAWAHQHLLPSEQEIWDRMAAPDRRHAVRVARATIAGLGDEPARAVVAGALLHDCGKIDSGLGTLARVGATVWGGVAGPRARRGIGRTARYLRHEELGSALLASVGSDPVTVALVGRTPDAPRPALDALARADDRA